MNAYELADWMDRWTENKPYPKQNPQIINMLRQQADQIAELKLNLGLAEHFEKKAQDRIESLLTMAEGFQSLIKHQADHITELEKDLHMVQRHYDQLGELK